MVDDIVECDMKKCKSVSLEIGRFISELSVKAISRPNPSIGEIDIDHLDNLLASIRNNCSMIEEDMNRINRNFVELKNISATVRGSRLVQPLSDLMNEIDLAKSDCNCQKIK